jgi:hypothetical protein
MESISYKRKQKENEDGQQGVPHPNSKRKLFQEVPVYCKTCVFRGRQLIARISVRKKPCEGCNAKFKCREKLLFYSIFYIEKWSDN